MRGFWVAFTLADIRTKTRHIGSLKLANDKFVRTLVGTSLHNRYRSKLRRNREAFNDDSWRHSANTT